MAATDSNSPGGAPEAVPGEVLSLTPEERETLRIVALDSIRHGLSTGGPAEVEAEGYTVALREPGAVFVTLNSQGRLRGCVGSYLPRRRLVEDVALNAFAAAFRDRRFPPLEDKELPDLEIHLSLVGPLVPLKVESREELLRILRPRVDGLLLEDPPHRSTFLPQVWESLPASEEFLAELFLKAGLSPGHWSSTLTFHRYTVEEF